MTYCPYLGTETEENFNVEHIIPEAIGGRRDYSIQVSVGINSQFGSTIDAALINHPEIRALCVHYGIKGKRGLPTIKLRGKSVEGDLRFDFIASDPMHVKVRVQNPVAKDPEDVNKNILSYAEGDGDKEMARIAKDAAKDGKDVVWEEETSLGEIDVNVYNEGDPLMAMLGLAKIAFGGLLHEFPNYSHDPIANLWRSLLKASTPEEVDMAGIDCGAYNQIEAVKAIVPVPIQSWEHVVSIANLGKAGIFVAVSLFGLENFHFLAQASTISNYEMKEGEIRMMICDTKAGKLDPRASTTRKVIISVEVDTDALTNLEGTSESKA